MNHGWRGGLLAACGLVASLPLSVTGTFEARAQNLPQLFGAILQMGMVQESWNALGRETQACVDRQLRQEGQSVQVLANNGVMADHPSVQPFIARCREIAASQRAWRSIDNGTRTCVGRLLQANNQSVQQLGEMGIGPSDAQATPLVSRCREIDATRKVWTSLDINVGKCVDRLLRSNGQNIDMLAEEQVSPSDPQAAPVMSRCRPISSQNLLKNFACTIEDMASRCDEFYVLEAAQNTPLDADQLANAVAAGRSVGKTQIEMPSAKSARMARVAERRKVVIADGAIKKIAPLLDPTNKFSYAKANELRGQIEGKRGNAKTTEADLIKLDAAATALVSAHQAEQERERIRREEMLARGEVLVSGEGSGANPKAARTDVYFQIFEKQLRDLVGSRADAEIGQQFKKIASQDIDKFRSTYFAGAPRETCRKGGPGQICSVEGTFKVGTLKSEVQRIMSATVSSPQQNFRFILAYKETDDEATRFLIDNIRAEFVNAGYRVVARGAEEQAEARGEFDFYLNILDIGYDDGRSDVGSIGGAGANVFETYVLKARVKLLDNAKDPAARHELGNVPVLNTKRLPRDAQMPREARRNQLLPMQAKELAKQVFRDVNDRILTLAAAPNSGAAGAGKIRLAGQWAIRITGLGQRDRDQIRALRNAVGRVLPGTQTTVDPDGTNDRSVEIRFDHADKFDTEDLVDAIYDAFKSHKKTFKVRYEGNNTFNGSL